MISRETITYLCGLSKLELTEEEIVKYEQQIEEIIRYMDILDGLTLSDIQPMSAEKRFYQLREDKIQSFDCDPLGDPKKRKDSYVKGPRII